MSPRARMIFLVPRSVMLYASCLGISWVAGGQSGIFLSFEVPILTPDSYVSYSINILIYYFADIWWRISIWQARKLIICGFLCVLCIVCFPKSCSGFFWLACPCTRAWGGVCVCSCVCVTLTCVLLVCCVCVRVSCMTRVSLCVCVLKSECAWQMCAIFSICPCVCVRSARVCVVFVYGMLKCVFWIVYVCRCVRVCVNRAYMQVRLRTIQFNVTALVTSQLRIDTPEKWFFTNFEKDMLPVRGRS